MKFVKIVGAIVGVIALLIVGYMFCDLYYPMQCADFVNPQRSLNACDKATETLAAIKDKDADTTSSLAYLCIWKHLAHLHAGENDEQAFESQAAQYQKLPWPATIIALYEGKISVEELYNKSKTIEAGDMKNRMCEAHFYVAEWYLHKNMKAEASSAFQEAQANCSWHMAESISLRTELKELGLN